MKIKVTFLFLVLPFFLPAQSCDSSHLEFVEYFDLLPFSSKEILEFKRLKISEIIQSPEYENGQFKNKNEFVYQFSKEGMLLSVSHNSISTFLNKKTNLIEKKVEKIAQTDYRYNSNGFLIYRHFYGIKKFEKFIENYDSIVYNKNDEVVYYYSIYRHFKDSLVSLYDEVQNNAQRKLIGREGNYRYGFERDTLTLSSKNKIIKRNNAYQLFENQTDSCKTCIVRAFDDRTSQTKESETWVIKDDLIQSHTKIEGSTYQTIYTYDSEKRLIYTKMNSDYVTKFYVYNKNNLVIQVFSIAPFKSETRYFYKFHN